MNLQTDVGKATVKQVCEVFGISRQAYYEAKRPTGQPEMKVPEAKPLKEPRWTSATVLLEAIVTIVATHAAWGSARCGRRCGGRRMG